MASPIILSVKFREERKLVSVSEGFSFMDFIGVLTGQWVSLKDNQFNCNCSIGKDVGICLNSEYDFNNMLLLCEITSTKIVNVVVKFRIDSSSGSGSDGSVRSHSDRVSGNFGEPMSVPVNVSVESPGVQKTNMHACDNYAHQKKEKQSRKNLCQQANFGGFFCDIPRYDVCSTLKRKSLLSDDWANIMVDGVGKDFRGGAAEFRSELIKYTTRMGFRFRYLRNDSRYIHVVCKEDGREPCDWFIKAKCKSVTRYFEIYKANMNHKCIGQLSNDTSRLGSKLMGSLVLQKVKAKPSISGVEIMDIMLDSYGFDISYSRAWRTVEAARNMLFGSYEDSYDQLRWYCSAILRTNLGSVVALEKNSSTDQFERVFIAFKACIDDFWSCRPMLFVDGTFMKGRAKGTLLSATGKDGNNGLFPVAMAVVVGGGFLLASPRCYIPPRIIITLPN